MSRRRVRALVGAGIVLAVLAGLNFYRVPVVVFAPGPILNVVGQVRISGPVRTYGSKGPLYLTTVGEWYEPNLYQTLLDLADPAVEIYPRDAIYPPGQTTQQVDLQDVADMSNSQLTAELVALRLLGYRVATTPVGAEIAGVLVGGPSVGKLLANDLVLEVNGHPVRNSARMDPIAQVAAAIQSHPVGSVVHFVVARGGKRVNVAIRTIGETGDPSRPIVGISLEDTYRLPFAVNVNVGDIGGPSAGMMIALSIYDKLSPIDLTGGRRIAGTGTVAPDGSVGMIGGVTQKMIAAQRGGATIFLVDQGDYAEAMRTRPKGLEVVGVRSVQQALHWLLTHTARPAPRAGDRDPARSS